MRKPTLFRKAIHFAEALWNHILDGFRKTPAHIKMSRMSQCLTCTHIAQNFDCTICGCPINEKTKWKSEKCPKGRWN